MAQAVGPEWKAAEEHLAMLANADKTVEMAQGLEECVQILTPEVRMRTPVGLTGNLLKSIKGETRVTAKGALQGVVWTNVFYSLYQELGTLGLREGEAERKRKRKPKSTGRGVPARLFFTGAWEENQRQCREILNGVVGKLVSFWKGERVS